MCEMCASESERDVSLLVLREKLKSPPATVSGESQHTPDTVACRPVALTFLLSILHYPTRWGFQPYIKHVYILYTSCTYNVLVGGII